MPAYFAERALTPDGWLRDVRIAVGADGTIESLVPGADAAGAERLAGPVVPGMVNLHSHAFQRVMAGMAERLGNAEDDFWTWRRTMYAVVERLGPDEMEAVARHLYVELLKSGYTTVAEFHYVHHAADGHPYDDPAELSARIIAAAADTGIGLTLLPVLYAHGGFGGLAVTEAQRRFANGVEDFLKLRARIPAPRIGCVGSAFHSLRAVTPDEMEAALRGLPDGVPLHIHVAEQEREVADCLAWSGLRPIRWLFEHMPVDGRWCLVHATHADPDELAAMAASGAVVGLCPTTEANLGDGIFPATGYVRLRGAFGIGSDSHVCVDPAEELRWLEYGQRLVERRRNRLADAARPSIGAFLHHAACMGGARASGQPVGALAPGRRADLVVLDGAHALLRECPDGAVLDRWLFAGSARLVRDVMVAGDWVVRDGYHAVEAVAAQGFASACRGLLDG
ncbi:MAG TPA: formimidoylglutamate deiminase [Arenibaculum sp.]|nr:formimidoylglutamate deiminase [Arenibaculum sp.]